MFPEVTSGFVSAHSPCWLINSQGKLSCRPVRNSPRNCFLRWHKESLGQTAPVDSENVKENWVADHSEIITETVYRDDRRNHQRAQHLLTQKMSRKTESLTTQKSSWKLFPEITEGILSAHSTCWLRKCQGKLSRWPLRNRHGNCFQRLQKESSARTAPVDKEKFKENWVADHSEIAPETVSRDYRRNPQRAQHLLTKKTSRKTESLTTQKLSRKLFTEMTEGILSAHTTCWLRKCQGKLSPWPLRNRHVNCFQRWQKESSARTTPADSENVKENWVADHSDIVTETVSRDDRRNPQRAQHLLTQKMSRKTESLTT